MATAEKLATLMERRKEELRKLVQVYYEERGWTPTGIPTVSTLKYPGLWPLLTEEARARIAALTS